MSLKNRIGAFLLLTGAIFLLIFAASVLDASGTYDLLAFLAGAASVALGWRWRFARPSAPAVGPTPPGGPEALNPPAARRRGLGALLSGAGRKGKK
jgi:hypothetical protein